MYNKSKKISTATIKHEGLKYKSIFRMISDGFRKQYYFFNETLSRRSNVK